jgi:hypothetical protein
VRHPAYRLPRRPRRRGAPAAQPRHDGDRCHPHRQTRQRRLWRARDDQPGDRPAGAGDGFQPDQEGEYTESLAALQHSVTGTEDGVHRQRQRDHQRRTGRQVQPDRDERRGGQREHPDGAAQRQAEPEGVLPVRSTGGVQRGRGLQAQGGDHADDEYRHQCAQFAERGPPEQVRRHDGEQIARRVAGHQGGGNRYRLPTQ